MPDIQTEMQKILRTWEEPYPQPETTEQPKETTVFKPTNNVSQQTFNFVRDNAGCTRVHAIQKLVQSGHKKSSVTSLIGQMLRQGHITKNNYGMLYPNGDEYRPIKSAKVIAKREAKVKKPKTFKLKTSGGLAALVNEPMAEAFEHRPDIRTSIDVIMDTVSLNDAHELYRRLHLYFGGLGK
jgi:hypothetical protein